MKKALVVFLIILTVLSPLAAKTSKTAENKTYVGGLVGYNGVRDPLIIVIAKALGMGIGTVITGGIAQPDVDILAENALAMGIDGYYELTPGFSMSTTAGCSVNFLEQGIVPSPFADVLFYGRMNGGPNGDFLMGGGIGTFTTVAPSGFSGYLSLVGAMRYQLDIKPNMGWWIDMSIGWNAFKFDNSGIKFTAEEITVMPSLRTGLSYAF